MHIKGFLNYRKQQWESYIKNVASLIQIQYLINHIYRIKLLKLYFKCKQNLLPVYLDSFDVTPNYRVHEHNTRNINKIHEPYVGHDFAKKCSRYELPILVNKTSPSIIQKVNTHSFKGFCTYINIYFVDNYSTTCDILNCYSCNSIPHQC